MPCYWRQTTAYSLQIYKWLVAIHWYNAHNVQRRHALTKAGSSRDSLRFLIISWATVMRYWLDLANWEKRRTSSHAKTNLGNATGEGRENFHIKANDQTLSQLLWKEIWNWMTDEHTADTIHTYFWQLRCIHIYTDPGISHIARRLHNINRVFQWYY